MDSFIRKYGFLTVACLNLILLIITLIQDKFEEEQEISLAVPTTETRKVSKVPVEVPMPDDYMNVYKGHES